MSRSYQFIHTLHHLVLMQKALKTALLLKSLSSCVVCHSKYTYILVLLSTGTQRNRRIHNEPVLLGSPVLLLQPTAGCLDILAQVLGAWQDPLPHVPSGQIRPRGSVTVHHPCHHDQQICHDISSETLSQVSMN